MFDCLLCHCHVLYIPFKISLGSLLSLFYKPGNYSRESLSQPASKGIQTQSDSRTLGCSGHTSVPQLPQILPWGGRALRSVSILCTPDSQDFPHSFIHSLFLPYLFPELPIFDMLWLGTRGTEKTQTWIHPQGRMFSPGVTWSYA